MKVVFITAGTGSYHCGSCMRDNALAVELRARGHDALLLPLYLPTMLDETSAPAAGLFFGGINVYLQHKIPLFRKTPRLIDRLFDSDRALKMAAKRAGMTRPEDLGDLTLSTLKGEDGNQRKELDRMADWLSSEFKPDVIVLGNALLIGLASRLKELTGAKVYCTLQGEDYFLDSLSEPFRSQCWSTMSAAAKTLDGLIAVSEYYRDVMVNRLGLIETPVQVVYNGISLDGYPDEPAEEHTPQVIGYLARMNPLKGLHVLVDGFIELRKRDPSCNARLHIGGSMTASDEPYVAELRTRLLKSGLADVAVFRPNLSRQDKIDFLRGCSIFSVPASYGESFGLYLLESWAAGVPVVQPDCSAFPELIEAAHGGVLFKKDDAGALAEALAKLLNNPVRRKALAESGRKTVRERFTVQNMADGVESILLNSK